VLLGSARPQLGRTGEIFSGSFGIKTSAGPAFLNLLSGSAWCSESAIMSNNVMAAASAMIFLTICTPPRIFRFETDGSNERLMHYTNAVSLAKVQEFFATLLDETVARKICQARARSKYAVRDH
jgi:hypothetical protein